MARQAPRLAGLMVAPAAISCTGPSSHPPPLVVADAGVESVLPDRYVPVPLAPSAPLVPASVAPPEAPPLAVGVSFPPFKRTTLPPEQLAQMVAASPELARVGGGITVFDPGDNPYLRRSKADHEGYAITPLPVLWSPEEGMELLVVAGRGKDGSFVAAWWPLPDGSYRLASAFVLLGEVAPVALAYQPLDRTVLQWTTCWRCPGEMGHVALRHAPGLDGPSQVLIVQEGPLHE